METLVSVAEPEGLMWIWLVDGVPCPWGCWASRDNWDNDEDPIWLLLMMVTLEGDCDVVLFGLIWDVKDDVGIDCCIKTVPWGNTGDTPRRFGVVMTTCWPGEVFTCMGVDDGDETMTNGGLEPGGLFRY